jgi:hypothetical protein
MRHDGLIYPLLPQQIFLASTITHSLMVVLMKAVIVVVMREIRNLAALTEAMTA